MSASLGSLTVRTPYQAIQNDHERGLASWLIYGLSANPVHKGHVSFCEHVAQALNPDRVIIIPNRVNPEKDPSEQCTTEQKLTMVQLAFQEHPDWTIDPQELRREGNSYTWMTIAELVHEAAGKASLYFLMSNESAEGFHLWDSPGESEQNYIIHHAHLVVAERPGYALDSTLFMERIKTIDSLARRCIATDTSVLLKNGKGEDVRVAIAGRHIKPIDQDLMTAFEGSFVSIPPVLEVSSTQIRKLCRSGLAEKELIEQLAPLVGPAIAQAIAAEKLFQKVT